MQRCLLLLIFALLAMALLAGCQGDSKSKIAYSAVPGRGDPERGELLYNESVRQMPACVSCHIPDNPASPDLTGFGAVAGERVAGESAHEYTFWAITEPGRHVLDGYGNAMYNQYDDKLTAQDIADLIAYLLTL